ncbi:zinc ABC transporter solute-binding protein [Candidatus Gracilibacteria bacterium]|nr:zinc ABC transporter solute-binding protein [Candidatus Gracilibacteria bacterium]
MKKIIVFIIVSLFLFSCADSKKDDVVKGAGKDIRKIQVETSIIPLASLVNYIGGDFVEVNSLVPAGVSPHGFDLKPEQMVQIDKADLIVYLNLEHIDGFLNKAIEKKDKLVVSKGIKLIEGAPHEHEEEGEKHEQDEHEEEAHSVDPHIWTSSVNALIIAEKIKNKLIELSPENKVYFDNNYTTLKGQLKLAKTDFLAATKGKKAKEFIVFHDAYNYLFTELGIDSKSKIVFQKSVLSDPNSSEMKELVDEIKLHSIKTAFSEPQFSDSNLQKLAKDNGLKIDILNPIGTDPTAKGYINNYKDSLLKLQKVYE